MPKTSSVIAPVTKAIKAIQDEKTALLKEIAALDQQLSEIVQAVGSSSSPVKASAKAAKAKPAKPVKAAKKAKSSKAKSGPYVPEKNSYAALVLAALKDGKEQHRDQIGDSVKAVMGAKFKVGSYGQSLNKLSNEKLIKKAGKRGFWLVA